MERYALLKMLLPEINKYFNVYIVIKKYFFKATLSSLLGTRTPYRGRCNMYMYSEGFEVDAASFVLMTALSVLYTHSTFFFFFFLLLQSQWAQGPNYRPVHHTIQHTMYNCSQLLIFCILF
jgi:hypothetical protein